MDYIYLALFSKAFYNQFLWMEAAPGGQTGCLKTGQSGLKPDRWPPRRWETALPEAGTGNCRELWFSLCWLNENMWEALWISTVTALPAAHNAGLTHFKSAIPAVRGEVSPFARSWATPLLQPGPGSARKSWLTRAREKCQRELKTTANHMVRNPDPGFLCLC